MRSYTGTQQNPATQGLLWLIRISITYNGGLQFCDIWLSLSWGGISRGGSPLSSAAIFLLKTLPPHLFHLKAFKMTGAVQYKRKSSTPHLYSTYISIFTNSTTDGATGPEGKVNPSRQMFTNWPPMEKDKRGIRYDGLLRTVPPLAS